MRYVPCPSHLYFIYILIKVSNMKFLLKSVLMGPNWYMGTDGLTQRRFSRLRSNAPRKWRGTVVLHLSGLVGTASQTEMQKIRIITVFIENVLHWQVWSGNKKFYKRLF
jgi:hypothetical protein